MKEEDQYLELFDAYQSGELNMKQKEALEARLRDDSMFRESYEKFLRNIALIKALGAGQEMGTMIEEAKRTRIVNRRYILVSALAAFVILFFLFNPFAQQSATDLFNEYYEPYPNILTSRDQFSSLDKAMQAYSSREFSKAIREFNGSLIVNDTVLFYRSLCHLSLNKPQKALEGFTRIKEPSTFFEESTWYKAMAYLLEDNLDSAEIYLQLVITQNSDFKSESLEIVSKLK